ncbi:MAG: carboxypeptidase-like regulatory domain-containing protein [Tannerella sp.]|jgi:hypothetical protein|nr:carboxypeptidase-like regulatory domain-containing protein [Tannerella sp.]
MTGKRQKPESICSTLRRIKPYEMERQTEYLFFYNKKNVNKRLNVKVKDTTVLGMLDKALDEDVAYTIVNDHIILSKKEDKAIVSLLQQTKRVTGTVTDSYGEALIGANIVEKGAVANGTITDADGNFRLNVADNAVLQVSCIGEFCYENKRFYDLRRRRLYTNGFSDGSGKINGTVLQGIRHSLKTPFNATITPARLNAIDIATPEGIEAYFNLFDDKIVPILNMPYINVPENYYFLRITRGHYYTNPNLEQIIL